MNFSHHTKNKSEPIQINHNKQSKHFPIEINALTTVSNIIKHHQLSFFSQSNHSVVPPYETNVKILKLLQKDLKTFLNTQKNQLRCLEVQYSNSKTELDQLKELNFLARNKNQELDFLIKQMKLKIQNLKAFAYLNEDFRENLNFINKTDYINKELFNDIQRLKKEKEYVLNHQKANQNEINFLLKEIKKTKEICESKNFRKKYINTTDIIEEDNMERSSIRKTNNSFYKKDFDVLKKGYLFGGALFKAKKQKQNGLFKNNNKTFILAGGGRMIEKIRKEMENREIKKRLSKSFDVDENKEGNVDMNITDTDVKELNVEKYIKPQEGCIKVRRRKTFDTNFKISNVK